LRVIDVEDNDFDIPHSIKWKLFLARQLALLALEKAHT